VYGAGHFYQLAAGNPAMNRVLFQLIGSYEGALHPLEKRGLVSVELFGAPGDRGAEELIADPEKYWLATIYPVFNYWYLEDPVNSTPQNTWVEKKPYTVAVLHNYKTKTGHFDAEKCQASKTIVFKNIKASPRNGSGNVTAQGPGSEGANASVTGLFYGAQGYALYEESYVDADDTAGSSATCTKVECYSSSSSTNLFDDANLFKTKTFSPSTVRWNIASLRDSNYDGSETWYVGFKVTYATTGTVPANSQVTKVFLGLDADHQGTAIVGE